MIMNIKILVFLLISTSTFNTSKAQPSIIDSTLKDKWCGASITVCESVCRSRSTVPAVNQCTGLNLLENCLCTDGFAPTLTNYENTVSYYLCEYNRPSGPCTNTCYLGTPDCIKLNNGRVTKTTTSGNKDPTENPNSNNTTGSKTPAGGGPTGGSDGKTPAGGSPIGDPAEGPDGKTPAGGSPTGGPGGVPGGVPADGKTPVDGPSPGGDGGGLPVGGPAGGIPGKVPPTTPSTPAGDGKIPTDSGTSSGNPSSGTNNPSGIIPNDTGNSANNKNVTIVIGVGASLSSMVIATILIIWFRRKRNKTQSGYFFDTITRNIGNAFNGNGNSTSSEEKRISTLKAGLVKGNTNTNSGGNFSTESSNLPLEELDDNNNNNNNEIINFNNKRASGILITKTTKTQSVSIEPDNEYFGTSSLSNISSANSFVSIDNSHNRSSFTSNNTKSINSIENLNTNSTSNLNNKYSSSDSGYLANSSNLNTSSEDDNSKFALNVLSTL